MIDYDGRVTQKYSFRNDVAHGHFTSNTIHAFDYARSRVAWESRDKICLMNFDDAFQERLFRINEDIYKSVQPDARFVAHARSPPLHSPGPLS